MKWQQKEKLDWEEQFLRMKRWFYRIRDKVDNDKEDFYLAFFECCHHFKNWIINDGVATNKEVEAYIEKHDALKLCADICTFSKHAEVIRAPRTGDPQTAFIGKKVLVNPFGPEVSYLESILQVKSNGNDYYDAFEIVIKCMDAWGDFLISKKVAIPEMPGEDIYKNFKKWEPQTPLK